MNIRELAAKADFNVTEFGIFSYKHFQDDVEGNLKKFADLVIKQCAKHLWSVDGEEFAEELMEHFEVEDERKM